MAITIVTIIRNHSIDLKLNLILLVYYYQKASINLTLCILIILFQVKDNINILSLHSFASIDNKASEFNLIF